MPRPSCLQIPVGNRVPDDHRCLEEPMTFSRFLQGSVGLLFCLLDRSSNFTKSIPGQQANNVTKQSRVSDRLVGKSGSVPDDSMSGHQEAVSMIIFRNTVMTVATLAATVGVVPVSEAVDRPPLVERETTAPGAINPSSRMKARRTESGFRCTFKTWASGLPAGEPPGGTGVYKFGMTLTVRNTGTTTVFSAHGRLNVNVNGQMKSKTCTIPSHMMVNQWVVNPGKTMTVPLECGSESNVASTRIMSGTAHLVSSDNKRFGCTMLMYLPPAAR